LGKNITEVIIVKKNKTLLAVLLGCVLAATAVAGGIAWNGSRDNRQGTQEDPISLEESTGDYLWNTPTKEPEKTNGEEDTAEEKTTTETEEKTEASTESKLEAPKTDQTAENAEDTLPAEQEVGMNDALALNFSADSKLGWPVQGEVIKEFSMDTTVYFPTLKQYKTNPAVLLQCPAGTQVLAAADGLVTAVGTNEEIGNFVSMDLGNGYAVTYGQLSEVSVTPNQYVTAGSSVGIVSSPTIYYVVEGDNLYFKMTQDGNPVDPLDYLQ
jgi:septal ring factor EnvC (AmiA/AmiB activator)